MSDLYTGTFFCWTYSGTILTDSLITGEEGASEEEEEDVPISFMYSLFLGFLGTSVVGVEGKSGSVLSSKTVLSQLFFKHFFTM